MTLAPPLPRARVHLAGRPLADDAAQAVTRVVMRQALNVPTLCEITLTDPPSDLTTESHVAPGTEVTVRSADGGPPPFEGHIAAVEHGFGGKEGRVVRLRAYDRLDELRRRRHLRVLGEPTLHDLALAVADAAGLEVRGGEDVELPHQLIQHRQCDLELLVEWAVRYGHYLACEGTRLHLVRLEPASADVTLQREAGGWRVQFEHTRVGALDRTEARGWDAGSLERRAGEWGSSAQVDAPTLWRTNRVLRGGNDEREHARAETERRDAGRLVTWGSGAGDTRLRAGTTVAVHGFGAAFEAPQRVTEVEHVLDGEEGFTTTFATDPPRPPAPREPTEVTVARVADARDPSGLGRVRVTLEAFGDVTSDWLPVLVLGAGPDKGLTVYPETEDVVLVLLCGADPSAGIVLGGLYGTTPSADDEVAERRPRPYSLRTPGGQRVRLDDDGGLVRLENADGSYLEMSAGEVVLHAMRDLRIEAPGRVLTLGARAIDMRST